MIPTPSPATHLPQHGEQTNEAPDQSQLLTDPPLFLTALSSSYRHPLSTCYKSVDLSNQHFPLYLQISVPPQCYPAADRHLARQEHCSYIYIFPSSLEMVMLMLLHRPPQVCKWMSWAFMDTLVNLLVQRLMKRLKSTGLVSSAVTAVCFPGLE